jgi:hypothetical protein
LVGFMPETFRGGQWYFAAAYVQLECTPNHQNQGMRLLENAKLGTNLHTSPYGDTVVECLLKPGPVTAIIDSIRLRTLCRGSFGEVGYQSVGRSAA